MNHKQKLGYMALGAGIMAVGITIGAIVCSPLVAQENGFFDKIVCREFEVVDKDGNKAIVLDSNERVNAVTVYDREGNKAIDLGSTKKYQFKGLENWVTILDKGKAAIILASFFSDSNVVAITDKQGNEAIQLFSQDIGDPAFDFKNVVQIWDNQGNKAISLGNHRYANWVDVYQKNQPNPEVHLFKAAGLGSNRDDNNWVRVVTKLGNFRNLGD